MYDYILSMDIQSGVHIVSLLRKYKKEVLIRGFEKFSYSERLRKCELPTLKYRRIR